MKDGQYSDKIGEIKFHKKYPKKYAKTPPKTEKNVTQIVIFKYFSFFAKIYGNKKMSVGIGKKLIQKKKLNKCKTQSFFLSTT